MSRVDAKHLALLVVGLTLAGMGCTEEGHLPVTYEPLGSARFVIVVPPALSTAGVDRVTVTSSRPQSESRSEPLLDSGGQWSGWIDQLRAVDGYTFDAEGSGARRFLARASEVSIPYSRTALVLLTAREPSPPAPTGNVAPFIDALVASTDTIEPGGEVSFHAQAHDANLGDAFSFSWEATSGFLKDTHSASEVWTAPEVEGPQTLTVTVTDSSGAAVSLELTLNVQSQSSREAPVRAVYREHPATPPAIEVVSASPASVGPGDVLQLGATATVSRGALSFAWTASAGTVSTPVSSAVHSDVLWVSPSCLPADVTPSVTVTVTNSAGLSDSRTLPVTWTGPACTRPACLFSLEDGRLSLPADCTTDTSLFIPDGYTFDGQGHSITAVDPPAGHFTGAIVRNRGGTARVRSMTVTTSGLKDVCESAPARLRGILLEGASGEVVDTTVNDINKGLTTSGCQEGIGIEVRNDDTSRGPFRVDVLRNRVSGYQKRGILAIGAVGVTIDSNTVEGGGPVNHIARNGIQVSDGATGSVTRNTVSGNAYVKADAVGAGVLVTGGTGKPLVTGLSIEGNTLTDNDVGIYLFQDTGDPPDTKARTRITHNELRNDAETNPAYQAAISDYYGTGSVISTNQISGTGYDPSTTPDHTLAVDVYTTRPAAKLSILTPGYDLAMGSCSGKVSVQSQDPVGNLVPSAGPFTLTASGPAASGVTFHADSGCSGAAITTVDLSKPQAEATFYFKSSQPGVATVTVSGGSLTTATQGQTIH
ncbi:right-handed parallel beta-helix repeat-containing protein [Vitiosangium sp. GDMCC 1.1324]|uniref:right-handed parallel beta-helix repeat-containing protein n=1 Tax=Vitiosangium sp. (strain GDMCC 1.1324) TaxID=2138576 RepID=UPI000D4001D6|nr:right-handed parallel beta-helix repeat-containing protein [Vitiosangium sp. GDMCC 1.1324]PTL84938.1 right-handed parallel beta-helix repeat-containing protein [Vitiosangium sp. GDMCC 1.1324]